MTRGKCTGCSVLSHSAAMIPSVEIHLIPSDLLRCYSMWGVHDILVTLELNYRELNPELANLPLKTGVLSAPILQSISFSSVSSKK